MSAIKLNVLFKKIQKDDKKEVLEFHVQGDELPFSQDLVKLAGSIVVLNVENSEAGEINVEFKSIQRDSKKTTLKFNVKGDSEEKVLKLYPLAGRSVNLHMNPSQMTIDEFNEPHEGVEYKVDKNGVAFVHPDQLTIEDVPEEVVQVPVDEDPFPSDDDLLN